MHATMKIKCKYLHIEMKLQFNKFTIKSLKMFLKTQHLYIKMWDYIMCFNTNQYRLIAHNFSKFIS